MDYNYYINKIKFYLTGNILESELEDNDFKQIIDYSIDSLKRYYDSTALVQVPASSCVDLSAVEQENNIYINSVAAVYRTSASGDSAEVSSTQTDPMQLIAWNNANNFYTYGTNRWTYNYLVYNTTKKIANTLSTDLDFKEDKIGRKLYISFNNGSSGNIVIEYIPNIQSPEDIVSDYWIDILSKLAIANAKITIGRIRTRYTQDNALWKQDGERLLEEGNAELDKLFERLNTKLNVTYPLD